MSSRYNLEIKLLAKMEPSVNDEPFTDFANVQQAKYGDFTYRPYCN